MKEIALEKGQWEQAALLSKQYELLKDSIEQGKNAESIRNVQAFYSYNEIEQDLWEARLYASKQKSFYSLLITLACFINSSPTAFHPLQARTKKPVTTVKSQ